MADVATAPAPQRPARSIGVFADFERPLSRAGTLLARRAAEEMRDRLAASIRLYADTWREHGRADIADAIESALQGACDTVTWIELKR